MLEYVRRRPLDPAARRPRAPRPAQADAARLPRRAHARARGRDGGGGRARGRRRWRVARAVRPARAHAGADARDHPARRLRPRPPARSSTTCARRSRRLLDLGASAADAAAAVPPSPRPADERGRASWTCATAASRADPRARSTSAGARARRATTCSRCCSPPADEDGRPMTDRELRDELVTLLVAGHETTASALSWGLRAARSARPDVLDRGDARGGRGTTAPTSRRRSRRSCAAGRCCRSPGRGASSGRSRIGGGARIPPAAPLAACIYLVQHDARHLPRALRVPARALPRGLRPARTAGSRSAAACAAVSAPSFAQLEMRIALRAILVVARGRLGAAGPRGHPPPLDHAPPPPRHADLRRPARARAGHRHRLSGSPQVPARRCVEARVRRLPSSNPSGVVRVAVQDLDT